MARTVRDANLESRTARTRLSASPKPHYRAIDTGLHLGYRKGKTGGRWVMRWYVGERNYKVETLDGAPDDVLDADGAIVLNFAQAQTIARRLYVDRKRASEGMSAPAGPYTVADAMTDYIAWLEQNRKTAKDAKWRSDALIVPDLGTTEGAKLTTKKIRDWLDSIASQSARIRTKSGTKQRFRAAAADGDPEEALRRRHASANRVLTILKAALNHAWREKKIPSDDAWRAVKPFKEADAARVRYLTIAEGKRLINSSATDFRRLVQAALLTGARFGELSALAVSDFNPDTGTLHVRTSKSGRGRHIVLTDEGIPFFKSLCLDRTSSDRLLTKDDGGRWLKSHQARPMNDACVAAKIAPPANFHVLRHTYASHSIMNGAPLLVVARNLGHADTRMVERHYGHMAPSYVADAIRAAAPRFGIQVDKKVVSMADREQA